MSDAATPFMDAMVKRRTYYQLKSSSPISDSRIQEIVKHAILHVPSSFNSQTERVLVLFKSEHEKLWDIVREILQAVVPPELFANTDKKLTWFRASYATILFFAHRPTIQTFQDKFALYADKFPVWAMHSDGMTQYAIWTALEAEGLGANVQHYNPLIDQKVATEWKVPEDWELSAQMVIGEPTGQPADKTFKEVEGERLMVYGA